MTLLIITNICKQYDVIQYIKNHWITYNFILTPQLIMQKLSCLEQAECLLLKYTVFSICLILVFPFDKSPTKLVMVLLPLVALTLITDLSFRNHLAVVL